MESEDIRRVRENREVRLAYAPSFRAVGKKSMAQSKHTHQVTYLPFDLDQDLIPGKKPGHPGRIVTSNDKITFRLQSFFLEPLA